MRHPSGARWWPIRLVFGAFFAHVALTHRQLDEKEAKALHRFACTGYPFLKPLHPQMFTGGMVVSETAVATALLVPWVPPVVGGAALTAFGTGLMGVYARAPGLRREHSVRPTEFGLAIAKDSWMVAAGLSILLDAFLGRWTRRRTESQALSASGD